MVELEVKCGDWGQPSSSQPLTWMCPEGHVFRYRRRPLLTSCFFIFCFFLMERGALYVLKTVLNMHLERTLGLSASAPCLGYMMISVFFGVYDSSPILIASISDTYLGAYKSIVIFGFVFVFGLSLITLVGGSWFEQALGPTWCAMVALLGLVAVSAGGLGPCLTAFGGSQFHPYVQTAGGSRFFSFIFASTSVGALLGIGTALVVYQSHPFRYLLLLAAILGVVGWLAFLVGSLFYVKRCVHTNSVKRMWHAAWACLSRFSFDLVVKPEQEGGNFSESEIEDVRIVARLVPIFACLIPLYLGQVQVLTTLRTMGLKLARPRSFGIHSYLPAEILLVFEPATALLLSLFLNYLLYPALQKRQLMPSHLARLMAGGGLVFVGFLASLAIQKFLMAADSETLVFETYSIFILVGPVVLFSAGQSLITSSGFELSYAYAPESMWSVSISLFSVIYALGSLLSVLLFYLAKPWLDSPTESLLETRSLSSTDDPRISIRLDVYFAVAAALCLLSLIGLTCLQGFHGRTRAMRIERDVEKRALQIALKRNMRTSSCL